MGVIKRYLHLSVWALLFVAGRLQAQEAHTFLQQKIVINAPSLAPDSVTRLIRTKTGLHFSFNAKTMAAGKPIVFLKTSYTVQELLVLVKASTNTAYSIYQDHIIFHRRTPETTPAVLPAPGALRHTAAGQPGYTNTSRVRTIPQKESPSGAAKTARSNVPQRVHTAVAKVSPRTDRTRPEKKAQQRRASPTSSFLAAQPNESDNQKSDTKKEQRADTSGQNKFVAPAIDRDETHNVPFLSISFPPAAQLPDKPVVQALQIYPDTQQADSIHRPRDRKRSPLFSPLFTDAGLAADESFYLQPTVHAGVPILHAIGSWSTNFDIGGFRFGLGTSFLLGRDWRLSVQATTGKMNRTHEEQVAPDSAGGAATTRTIAVKSDLHRLGLIIEKRIGNKWQFRGGPVFNYMTSAYSHNGQPTGLAGIGLTGNSGDEQYYTLKPFYTLSNSYSDSEPTSIKTWVGFQVGLFYRFRR